MLSKASLGGSTSTLLPIFDSRENWKSKAANVRDIQTENNLSLDLIPQIITKDAGELLFVAKYVQKLGYKELNWNLGCPYPMVAKRGMGSGLLAQPGKIDEILNRVSAESDIQVS